MRAAFIWIALTSGAAQIKPTNGLDQEWKPSEALHRSLKRTKADETHLAQLMRTRA
jgi:hypothetical protein